MKRHYSRHVNSRGESHGQENEAEAQGRKTRHEEEEEGQGSESWGSHHRRVGIKGCDPERRPLRTPAFPASPAESYRREIREGARFLGGQEGRVGRPRSLAGDPTRPQANVAEAGGSTPPLPA